MIVFAAIMPHPPESIPGIGKTGDFNAIQKTLNSFNELRMGLEQADPDTIVVISPHAELEPYSFVVNSASKLVGNFADFGLDEAYSYENDIGIVDSIVFACSLSLGDMPGLPVHLQQNFLDHGALIPLYHLTKNIKPRIVHLAFSLMNYDSHFRYGEILQKVFEKNENRIAIIASADLSHKLTPDAPAGFSQRAQEFDRALLHFLENNYVTNIIGLDNILVKEAAECGLRSIIILLGILHGMPYKFKLLSYECPSGIGYMTARML